MYSFHASIRLEHDLPRTSDRWEELTLHAGRSSWIYHEVCDVLFFSLLWVRQYPRGRLRCETGSRIKWCKGQLQRPCSGHDAWVRKKTFMVQTRKMLGLTVIHHSLAYPDSLYVCIYVGLYKQYMTYDHKHTKNTQTHIDMSSSCFLFQGIRGKVCQCGQISKVHILLPINKIGLVLIFLPRRTPFE